MYSVNEWGKLKKVVVGVADHAIVPPLDKSLRTINYAGISDEDVIKSGPYPQQVIDEANEDLEIFVKFLKGEGVEVVRSNREETNYYNFCPRDCVFLHGEFALATPMPLRSRLGNWRSYKQHLENVTEIPCCYFDELYNIDCIGNPDILALTDITPAFDAANIIRANGDILYLVSNTGNKIGAKLLQKLLDEVYYGEVNVHLLEGIYSYAHIDTTVAFLREGLLMVNPSRIKNKDDLPEPFNHWDIIWCPEPVDIGYYPGYNSASAWSNMNLMSISSELVALEEHQEPTRKELEKFGIECAMLPMRQGRTLSGFFHCVTLDLEREEE
jgi:glycine amidinotransferase